MINIRSSWFYQIVNCVAYEIDELRCRNVTKCDVRVREHGGDRSHSKAYAETKRRGLDTQELLLKVRMISLMLVMSQLFERTLVACLQKNEFRIFYYVLDVLIEYGDHGLAPRVVADRGKSR